VQRGRYLQSTNTVFRWRITNNNYFRCACTRLFFPPDFVTTATLFVVDRFLFYFLVLFKKKTTLILLLHCIKNIKFSKADALFFWKIRAAVRGGGNDKCELKKCVAGPPPPHPFREKILFRWAYVYALCMCFYVYLLFIIILLCVVYDYTFTIHACLYII